MKKMIWMLMAAVSLTATAAHAQTRPGFEAGVEVVDYGYREHFEGEELARDNGRFYGFSAGYTKGFGNKNFFRGRLSLDFGSADYRSGDDRLNGVSQTFGRLELHLGRDFAVSDRMTISPFIGIASRVLLDDSGGEETAGGAAGYDRVVAYRYVPVGAATTVPLHGPATLTLSAQYHHLIGGHVESKLSAIDPALPDVSVRLRNGSGYEVSAMVNIPIGGKTLSVGPFVSGWHIGESGSVLIKDPEGSGEMLELFEPPNRTTTAGARLTFSF
ncbi:MAG TPA: hypothetical protein VJZ76_21915 [Thermoanaerobaculia bacterium]|nr:hypothetical protein [Thermoanaerobaculia bacterium]